MLPLRTDPLFGATLKEMLDKKAMTIKELAFETGIGYSTIGRYIKARVFIRNGITISSLKPNTDNWNRMNKFFYPDEVIVNEKDNSFRKRQIDKMIEKSVPDKNIKTCWQPIQPWTLETKSIQIQKMKEIPNRKRVRNCF